MNNEDIISILHPPVDRAKLISIIRKFSKLSPIVQASACIFIMTMEQEQLDKLAHVIAEIIQMEPAQQKQVLSGLVEKLHLPHELQSVIGQYANDITKV